MLDRLVSSIPLSRTGIIVLHDVAVVVASLPLALVLVGSGAWGGRGFAAVPLLVAATLAAAFAVGSHRGVWRYISSGEVLRVALFAATALGLWYLVHSLADRSGSIPARVPVVQFFVATFLLLISRIAYSEILRWSHARGCGCGARERVLLVGSGDGAALFQHLVAHEPEPRYEVVGILSNSHGRHRTIGGVSVLGGFDELDRVLAALRVQDMSPARIIVTCPHHVVGRRALYEVMERAHVQGVPVLQLPELMRLRHRRHSVPAETWQPLIGQERGAVYPALKRGADILVAGLGLIVCAPLLLAIAVFVAATIQQPVFFVQVRPGLDRHPFKLWKFRTMRDPVGEDGRVLSDEARTPWFGRLLRRSRLDELPQLWNVLTGDMALIGPRPLLAADLDCMADGGVARCRIRPGITGWAQVNGGHQLTAEEKLALDLWYAEHATLWLDGVIVARTLAMMLWGERRNAEAIESALGHRSAVAIAAE